VNDYWVTMLIMTPEGAYPFLALDDRLLAHACRVEAYQASGPGGQKRNRTYSAVRLSHAATNISVIAEESRSQNENKLRALRRLRMALALRVRKQPGAACPAIPDTITVYFKQDTPLQVNQRNPLYPLVCATILDALYFKQGSIGDASRLLGLSTGRLSRFLGRDRDLLHAVNELRSHFNLKPLKQD
jgi:hypothetical protein